MAQYQITASPDGPVLRLSGRVTLARLGELPGALPALDTVAAINLDEVERVDTVGAWLIVRTAAQFDAAISGGTRQTRQLIDAVRAASGNAEQPLPAVPAWRQFLDDIGDGTRRTLREFIGIIGFLGATVAAIAAMVVNRRRVRWHAVVAGFQAVGVNALAIIGLMSFLIGIVIAQQGATQLQQFGLEMFTINLVGRASMRELGLLMTAIMVAGRSGSAFAAQIGTMKLTEEVDALRTIGVSPMESIVIPRVLATVLMMPLLGFFAGIAAIAGGGLFCWFGLGIPPLTYVQRLQDIIPMTDYYIMLIKAPVFALIVAVTGCYSGMQVQQNAAEVGERTTAAVVAGIFLVIVLDAFFAVFFTALGWD